MVTATRSEVHELARDLTDRLIRRGRVPSNLRETAEAFMRTELQRAVRRVVRCTSQNASLLLLSERGQKSSNV